MGDLAWLMDWYSSHCDGEWEHSFGVQITTLDNPGWHVEIELTDTELQDRPFEKVEHDLKSDVSWWICSVKDTRFDAACGPRDLATVLAIFRQWAT